MNIQDLYIKAKKAYYQGEPIMTDAEFDRLESELESQGLLSKIVGFDDDDRNAKFKHPSKMLSLAKFQAKADGTPPISQATSWMQNLNQEWYEATPKFDGNAINIIYRNGRLDAILSRGNGTAGRDYTDKLIANVPQTIPTDFDTVEIRGEVVISTKIFDEKYSKFKNERNFVAGILNRDEDVTKITKDFTFMAVEARGYTQGQMHHLSTDHMINFGINLEHTLFTYIFGQNEFEQAYKSMLHYRQHKSPFRLDGFVIKTPHKNRAQIGENSHDPNWAVAIKFPPEEATTKIIDIQWNFGKTGELTPVAILEPILLDGSTVRRASVHNYGWMTSKGCIPGALVTIAKKGDIIPQIINIISPSTEAYEHPTNCPKCGEATEIDNKVHLQCSNETCGGVEYLKFVQGFNQLSIDGTAGAMIKKVYASGFEDIMDVLDKQKFTIENLTKEGILKEGKTLTKMYEQVNAFNQIPLFKAIKFLGIEGMGSTIAKQIAKKITGIDYSFKGLEKAVCEGFDQGEDRYNQLMDIIKRLQANDIEIIYPEEVSKDLIRYEMTGSPKAFGFPAKKDFTDYAASKGYIHSKLNDADVLITDDLNGSSAKMKSAKKKGIKIMLYTDVK